MPKINSLSATNISMQSSEGLEKPGTVKGWGATAIPTGWLELLGQVVLRADYPGLFAIFSTTFNTGGETSGEFRLPNGQGRSLVGAGTYTDPVSGPVSRTIGQVLGAEKHAVAVAELPSHDHGGGAHTHFAVADAAVTVALSASNQLARNGSVGGGDTDYFLNGTPTGAGLARTSSVSNIAAQGSGTAHNNMQPSLGLKWIVKT
jgi:microcystin-dependent protein